MSCATIKAKLATLLSDLNFIAGRVVQLDTCLVLQNDFGWGGVTVTPPPRFFLGRLSVTAPPPPK